MRSKRILKWVLIVSAVAGLLTVGVLYLLAGRIPPRYAPARLTKAEKDLSAREFLRKIQDFGNASQRNSAYRWSVTQEQCNAYLASMDEIAAAAPGRRQVTVSEKLNAAGLAYPAVAFDDGVLTVMITAKRLNKVLSADLSFEFTDDGRLRVCLKGARLGSLPIPDSLVRRRIEKLTVMLTPLGGKVASPDAKSRGGPVAGVSVGELASVLAVVAAAIGEEPIDPEITWPIKKKRVRIDAIDIDDGLLTLSVKPSRRRSHGASQ